MKVAVWLAVGVLTGSQASPAAAALPMKIVFHGSGLWTPVEITATQDLTALELLLCGEQAAGSLEGRAALTVRVVWGEGPGGLIWRGSFYPATDAHPAAVHIPAWKLYGPARVMTCGARLVGGEALAILARHRVPVHVDLLRRSSHRPELIAL